MKSISGFGCGEDLKQTINERRTIMRNNNRIPLIIFFVLALIVMIITPVLGQDKPADTMQIVLEKVRADKKLLVAANMQLTET
jgi:hypothetical protein